jgi:hypothetical protein
MANKKMKKTDEETLKHYTSPDAPIIPSGAQDASKPIFIKPTISIDRLMSGRKSAVIKVPDVKIPLRKKNIPHTKKKGDKY